MLDTLSYTDTKSLVQHHTTQQSTRHQVLLLLSSQHNQQDRVLSKITNRLGTPHTTSLGLQATLLTPHYIYIASHNFHYSQVQHQSTRCTLPISALVTAQVLFFSKYIYTYNTHIHLLYQVQSTKLKLSQLSQSQMTKFKSLPLYQQAILSQRYT